MMWRDVLGLITVTQTQDEYGAEVETNSEPVMVFCNKKSVKSTEFYQAAAVGIKPEIVFEIREAEYADQPKVLYGDKVYHVIRTYSKGGELLELTCSRYPMEG